MIRWRIPLYVGASVRAELAGLLQKAEEDAASYKGDACLIVLSPEPAARVEILSLKELRHKYYREKRLIGLGLAGGRQEALVQVQRLVNDCLRERGHADLGEYFSDLNDSVLKATREVIASLP